MPEGLGNLRVLNRVPDFEALERTAIFTWVVSVKEECGPPSTYRATFSRQQRSQEMKVTCAVNQIQTLCLKITQLRLAHSDWYKWMVTHKVSILVVGDSKHGIAASHLDKPQRIFRNKLNRPKKRYKIFLRFCELGLHVSFLWASSVCIIISSDL